MSIANLKDVLEKATDEGYAVGAFNVHNLEFVKGVMRAAVELNSPVILSIAPISIDYAGLDALASLVTIHAEQCRIPTVIHLDHGGDLETIQRSIELGFSSVMFDGSKLPMEENVKVTQKAVKLAHDAGVSVEGEIGVVGGFEGLSSKVVHMEELEKLYTKPEDAMHFVGETGVDALAVAVGTVHCMPFQKARIDFTRLQEIHDAVSVPLVFHGCTGLKDEDYQRASVLGVKKFNIGTKLIMAFQEALRGEVLRNEKTLLMCLKEGTDAVYKAVKDRIKILNSAGKA